MNAHERRVLRRASRRPFKTGLAIINMASIRRLLERGVVPPELWGRDHVSTFAYAMSRIFGNGGKIERAQMRVGPHHPGLEHVPTAMRMEHPTRLADGSEKYGHDDYDCIDDLVAAGLFKYVGTGVTPGVVSDPSPEALDWAKRIAAVEAAGGRWSAVKFK